MFCAILFVGLVTFSFVALSIAKYDYATLEVNNALKFTKPNAEYWFGTDNIGRDLLGARYGLPPRLRSAWR